MTAWLVLLPVLLASFFEVVRACATKLFRGFAARLPSVMTVVGGIASILLPAPTGLGMIGAALCADLFFRERFLLPRLVRVLLIVTGITGLRLPTKNGLPTRFDRSFRSGIAGRRIALSAVWRAGGR